MIIPVLICLSLIVFFLIAYAERHMDDGSLAGIFGFIAAVVFGIWLLMLTGAYMKMKGDMFVIDDKIAYTEKINEQRVNSVLPILEKYPKLEVELIKGIDIRAFAVLGDVYPELKSNESYKQQAKVVMDNLKKVERLNLQKIDLKRDAAVIGWQLFLFQ